MYARVNMVLGQEAFYLCNWFKEYLTDFREKYNYILCSLTIVKLFCNF